MVRGTLTMKRYLLITFIIALAIISHKGVLAHLGNAPKAKPASTPATGDIMIDPSSGTRIVRITDTSDAASAKVAYTNCARFNQDSTRFVIDLDGVATLYSFDPSRLAAQKVGPLFDSMKLQFDSSFWSATDPDTLIGLADSEGVPQLYSYDVRTRSFTLLKDFLGILPEGISARMTKSANDDNQFVFSWREPAAIVWQHVVLWDRNLDSTYLFDLTDSTSGVTGYREAYLDESSESLIVVGDTTRAWRFRIQPQAGAAESNSRMMDRPGLQASLASIYRDGAEAGEAVAADWQESSAAISSTNKHVYFGVRPGATRGSSWAKVPGSTVYYTELASESFKGALGFVSWRGHELIVSESALLGPGEWHLDAATNRLYVRLPDDSNPNAAGSADNAPVIGEVSSSTDDVVRIARNARAIAEQLSGPDSSLWERRSQLRGNLSRDKRFFIFNSGSKGLRSDVFIAALNVAAAGMDSVVWTHTINCTALSNSVQKTAGQDQVDDASATSLQTIDAGDGFVEFTATDTDKERWCGLNNSNAIHQSASDINFAIKMAKKKKAWVIEDGVIKAKLKYKSNTSFRVAVEAGKIKYYKDGNVIYTSENAPVYPLMINASLINTNSSVSNVMVAGAGFGTVVSISPAKVSLQPGGTQQFTVRVTGGANNNVNWTATGGTITSTGFYTAPATPGAYIVTATSVASPGSAAFAAVIVGQGSDRTPPIISTVASSNVTANSVTISWNTNEPSDTEVEYGLTTAYGETSIRNPALVTSHSVALGGLPASTLIHYRVRSRDAAGNLAVSGNFSFTTAAGSDTTPPAISNVAISGVTAVGATITWTTNEASDTLVEYGATTNYGSASQLNSNMVTSHSATLTGLTGGRLYHYRVKSRDAAGNQGVSGDFTFTTATGSGGGGGSDVPLSYNAITDRNPRAEPPLPAMGPAGSRITDPTFGTRILRVTDGNTRPDRLRRSFGPPSGSEQNTWNVDSTIFFLGGTNGEMLPYSFDKATMTATRMGDRNNGSGGMMLNIAKCEFSFMDKNIIYGLGGNGRTFMQYNFQTGAYTTLFNLDSAIPGLSGNTGDVSASGNDRLSTYFGGPVQDSHMFVVVWDKSTGQYAILNTQNSTVKSFGSSSFQPVGTTIGFTLHNARIGKEGRYVVMTPGSSASHALYVWDTQTNVVAPVPQPGGGGHKVNGYNALVNHAAPPNDAAHADAAQWLLRPLNTSQLNNITRLATPALTPLEWAVDTHVSWNNARPGVLTPVLVSLYRDPGAAGPRRAWDDEIIALRTDGVESKAWRICHHRSQVFPYKFDYSPRGNVSQDGRYFSFASNWERTLGDDEYGEPRFDLFIVELPAGNSGPPPPPPPGDSTPPVISGVNASGITSSTANIAWVTNEASDTLVEYGATTNYGSASQLNSNMVTSHSATLTGLTGGRLYHYRVKSRDAAGNQGVSGDFTFTTATGSGGGGGGGGGSTQSVAWTNLVNVAANGNSLRNNVSGNGGATSTQRIESGNGYVEFTATETNTYRWAGLSNGNNGIGYDDIDFAINLTSYGHNGGFVANIHENGAYKGETLYNSGDVFRVAVEGGAVKYYKNGSLIYTSARAPAYPLIVDTSFGEVGGTITNARISGDSGLANLTIPMLFDEASRYNAGLSWPVINPTGSAGLVEWLLLGRKDYLFFGRRFAQS
jgi:hypothetical protein